MTYRLDVREPEWETPTPESDAADPTVPQQADRVRAAVFPAPLLTMAAGSLGALIGFATIYLLAALRVEPLYGVGVIILLFALALSGPKLLADSRTDVGRTAAVVLNAIAFGGTFGGLVVLLIT